MFRNTKILSLLLVVAMLAMASQALAEGIKERMRKRLPVIIELKAAGVVGENNQGYLTLRQKNSERQKLIEAENRDRREVYGVIAKKKGTTAELVGQRRALQIVKKADPGTWVQGPKGKWYQK